MKGLQADEEFARKHSDLAFPGRWGVWVKAGSDSRLVPLIAVDAEVTAVGGRIQVRVSYLHLHNGDTTGQGFFSFPIPDSATMKSVVGAIRRQGVITQLSPQSLGFQTHGASPDYLTCPQIRKSEFLSPAWRLAWFRLGEIERGDALLLRLSYCLHSIPESGLYDFVLPFPVEYRYRPAMPYLGLDQQSFWAMDQGGSLILPEQDDTWRQGVDSRTCRVDVRAHIYGFRGEKPGVTSMRHPLGRTYCKVRIPRIDDPWWEFLMDDPLTPDWRISWSCIPKGVIKPRAWKWQWGPDDYMLLEISARDRPDPVPRRPGSFLFLVDASAFPILPHHAYSAWDKMEELINGLGKEDTFSYALVNGEEKYLQMEKDRDSKGSVHFDRALILPSNRFKASCVMPSIRAWYESTCSGRVEGKEVTVILITGGAIQDLAELRVWLEQKPDCNLHALMIGRPPAPHLLQKLVREHCGLVRHFDPTSPLVRCSSFFHELVIGPWVSHIDYPADWEVVGLAPRRIYSGGTVEALLRRRHREGDASISIKLNFSTGLQETHTVDADNLHVAFPVE